MSMEVRSQGRPGRGDNAVGRERLLAKTRDALKGKPRIDMQRREIAMFAGVTPALVSYYFPDKWDLLAAAAKPVVESHIADMRAVMRSDEPPHLKIFSLTHLFIAFNVQHGYLLDFYLENSARMARQDDLRRLEEVNADMQLFFGDLLREGLVRGDSPAFIQSSLWGLCKAVARQPDLAGLLGSDEGNSVTRAQAEKVCDLFLSGAATPGLLDRTDRTAARPTFPSFGSDGPHAGWTATAAS